MDSQSVFERVVACFESQSELARKLGITAQSLGQWKRQIPANRVLEIERLTESRVTRYEMRPDVFGERVA
jgi:DNA-binding transcriptional regulator YdaS (Cro superfamily)